MGSIRSPDPLPRFALCAEHSRVTRGRFSTPPRCSRRPVTDAVGHRDLGHVGQDRFAGLELVGDGDRDAEQPVGGAGGDVRFEEVLLAVGGLFELAQCDEVGAVDEPPVGGVTSAADAWAIASRRLSALVTSRAPVRAPV